MDKPLFYCSPELENSSNLIKELKKYSENEGKTVYIIKQPLMKLQDENAYDYDKAFIVLIPRHKIFFYNTSLEDDDLFDEYYEDVISDIDAISDTYKYRDYLGRSRHWKKKITEKRNKKTVVNLKQLLSLIKLENKNEQRQADMLISLFIGSINDSKKICFDAPESLLEAVKKKIVLYDGDQSRFIYKEIPNRKNISIQGLAGTGKTELLLHKLRELYCSDSSLKIVFTCYNKILAKTMRKRVPEFFDFMKVSEQIKWDERLFVMHSWGSQKNKYSGVYSYICNYYKLPFLSWKEQPNFDDICKSALDILQERNECKDIEPCFDYMLVDESQDFSENFFNLCNKVTRYTVYRAGDIFQKIYSTNIVSKVKSDYALNRCYRTDSRTLIFAHALSMGLCENTPIRWLEDDEWEACGYNLFRHDDNKIEICRNPVNRFNEDDFDKVQSIVLQECHQNEYIEAICNVIETIKDKNKDIFPGDIAVVFLEDNRENYKHADILKEKINNRFKWNAIKSYEDKTQSEDAVFISNKNNIKGLEFPFVICVATQKISDDIRSRNTIYMMLTRSLITSYFIADEKNKLILDLYKKNIELLNKEGKIFVNEPTEEIKNNLKNKLEFIINKQESIYEIVNKFIEEKCMDMSNEFREKIFSNLKQIAIEQHLNSIDIYKKGQMLIDVFSSDDV